MESNKFCAQFYFQLRIYTDLNCSLLIETIRETFYIIEIYYFNNVTFGGFLCILRLKILWNWFIREKSFLLIVFTILQSSTAHVFKPIYRDIHDHSQLLSKLITISFSNEFKNFIMDYIKDPETDPTYLGHGDLSFGVGFTSVKSLTCDKIR